MAPLTVPPSLAKSASVPCPASTMRASMVPLVDGLMGAAAMRMLNAAGEIALASAETGSHMLWAVNGSTLTFWIPMSRNFLAAHSIARSHAADPVGRPPIPSHSSRKSDISGVSPCARAAKRCGASSASSAGPKSRQPQAQARGPNRLAISIIPVDHSFFHHEHDLLDLPDILDRVARNHHHVRELSRFQRSHSA